MTTIAVSSLDNEIFASDGSTVTIYCTVNSTERLIWQYSFFSEKLIFNKIADGNSINPTLRNSFRYHINSDVETENKICIYQMLPVTTTVFIDAVTLHKTRPVTMKYICG